MSFGFEEISGDENLRLLPPTEQTRTPRGDQARLPARRGVALARRRVADVLVVATAVRVLHGVHRHAAHLRPAVALHPVLVVRTARLQHRLVQASAARNNADHRAHGRLERLARAGRQPDLRRALLAVVRDERAVVARALGDLAAVPGLALEVADDRPLGHRTDRQDVARRELGLDTAVDELPGVHALRGAHELLVELEAVRVAEVHLNQGRAAPGVVDDLLDDTLDVAVALTVVIDAELRGTLAVLGVGHEDSAGALTLAPDDTAHLKER